MLLGLFRRVALLKERRKDDRTLRRINFLLDASMSDPDTPLNMATFWRDVGCSIFTDLSMDKQICYALNRNHESLSTILRLLDKSQQLIVKDDYEHLTQYLNRQLTTKYDSPVSVYLTNDNGIPIDTDALFIQVNTLLYSLAAILHGMESFEYHRVLNTLYRELLNLVARLLEIKYM